MQICFFFFSKIGTMYAEGHPIQSVRRYIMRWNIFFNIIYWIPCWLNVLTSKQFNLFVSKNLPPCHRPEIYFNIFYIFFFASKIYAFSMERDNNSYFFISSRFFSIIFYNAEVIIALHSSVAFQNHFKPIYQSSFCLFIFFFYFLFSRCQIKNRKTCT